jgi:hypothetical protein
MDGFNPRAIIGANNPPDPIDTITAPYDDARAEVENWADGGKVETEGQMNTVDTLRKDMRAWRLALEAGQKEATAHLYTAYKTELDRWKSTIEDAKRLEGCLVSMTDGFKRKLAAEKAEVERKAQAEAWEATRKAREAAQLADASNIEAQRAAANAMAEAEAAHHRAAIAAKDTVKGLRTVTKFEVTDHKALLNWIAKNDRDAITAFIDEYARKNHKTTKAGADDGLSVWQSQEAY